MRILWFEVTRPLRYRQDGRVIGGWQDSLESLLAGVPDLELIVAFEGTADDSQVKKIDGITYVPIQVDYSWRERLSLRWSWDANAAKLIPPMVSIVKEYRPDLIHVFGVEWPFGLIAEHVDVPVVIHIQGALIPYSNANFPPGYGIRDCLSAIPWWNVKSRIGYRMRMKKEVSWRRIEEKTWRVVGNYMGRTAWDEALSSVLHPGRRYFHVEEAIRPSFLKPDRSVWTGGRTGCVRLITTGCSTFWKGPDMLLKTAHILKDSGVAFEWLVAGEMPPMLKRTVEKHEGMKFEDNQVRFLGFVDPDTLAGLLIESTLYVHTAYVENSPNSICEAQLLGVPVISTNVGGIPSLLENGKEGVLVPANDPWQMAGAIMGLIADRKRMNAFSQASRIRAAARHSKDNVLSGLMACYSALITV